MLRWHVDEACRLRRMGAAVDISVHNGQSHCCHSLVPPACPRLCTEVNTGVEASFERRANGAGKRAERDIPAA